MIQGMLLFLVLASSAFGKVFISLPEVLERERGLNPGSEWQAQTFYLTRSEIESAEQRSGVKIDGGLVTRHRLLLAGKVIEDAYVDAHRVRTHPESLLVILAGGAVTRAEVLSFDEPLEYLPKALWYDSFKARKLDSELQMKKKIPFVTGATLSAKAATDAVRRVLALDQVISARSHP